MGKRDFRKGKGSGKTFGKRADENRNLLWEDLPRENEKWETYYKSLNIVPEEEWETFKKACQENLPVTFRITGSKSHAHELKENFIKNHVARLKDIEFEGLKMQPRELAYYPDQRGWQMDISKGVIRKNKEFAKTQRFLVLETDVGNIYRQEAVSMIPPLLMDIKPHHSVLDMCAAPGSKTAQLVEAMHQADSDEPTGFVMANDSDYKRSHMLVHQVKRLNSPNFIVVNHDAQMFPRIKLNNATEFLKFDRILCDVPCSGDGTMRKNLNVWKDFTIGNGLGLHPLQVNILNRGLQLLKRGGRLVYSTCSLSPVENEAVVAAALRKWGSQIRVVNCDDELPGLIRRKGISDWKVYSKDMQVRERGDENIVQSAFPPTEEEAKEFNLSNCIRVYPHLQNTGGFFITVFEKVELPSDAAKRPAPESTEEEASKKQKTSINPLCQPHHQPKQRLPRDANEEPFIFLDSDNEQLAKCWPFYGVSEDFPRDSTLVRNATGEPVRTIYYVAPVIKSILTADEQKLKVVHAGTKLFVSQRNDSGNCAWRVQNESLHTIRKYLSDKRQLSCNLKLLELLFQEAFPKIHAIKESGIDPEFSEKLETLEDGCVFVTVTRGDGLEDLFLPLWKGKSNVNLMVNKKDTQELLYRVFNIDTSAKDKGKEHAYQDKVEGHERPARTIALGVVAETADPAQSSEAVETAQSAETPELSETAEQTSETN